MLAGGTGRRRGTDGGGSAVTCGLCSGLSLPGTVAGRATSTGDRWNEGAAAGGSGAGAGSTCCSGRSAREEGTDLAASPAGPAGACPLAVAGLGTSADTGGAGAITAGAAGAGAAAGRAGAAGAIGKVAGTCRDGLPGNVGAPSR